MHLPPRYIPSSLRDAGPKRTEVMYACGYEHKPGSFGMWDGPNPDVMEMLEAIPEEEDNNPVIIRFNLDGTDKVIYRWISNKDGYGLWDKV